MVDRPTLADIRRDLEAQRGQRLRLTANRGRQRIIVREGILEQTYPNIFTIRLLENNTVERVSFSYSDVLTKTVEISPVGDDDEQQIAYN